VASATGANFKVVVRRLHFGVGSVLTSFSLAANSCSVPGLAPDSPCPGLFSEASLACLAGMLEDEWADEEDVLLLLSELPWPANCSFRAVTSFSARVALCNQKQKCHLVCVFVGIWRVEANR